MTLVLGIDPGSGGAFAVYDTQTRSLVGPIKDVPIWYQQVGKRRRPRIDALGVADLLETYELMGVGFIIMEAVGGHRGQNTAHAFTFGYGVGIVYMACFYSGIPFDTVPPQTWKQVLRVPGKSKADDTAIIARADELLPDSRRLWRGPKGGRLVDRAEAAMIAKYGGDEALSSLSPSEKIRERLKQADTGA